MKQKHDRICAFNRPIPRGSLLQSLVNMQVGKVSNMKYINRLQDMKYSKCEVKYSIDHSRRHLSK